MKRVVNLRCAFLALAVVSYFLAIWGRGQEQLEESEDNFELRKKLEELEAAVENQRRILKELEEKLERLKQQAERKQKLSRQEAKESVTQAVQPFLLGSEADSFSKASEEEELNRLIETQTQRGQLEPQPRQSEPGRDRGFLTPLGGSEAQVFNPKISAVVDVFGQLGSAEDEDELKSGIFLRSLEVGLQASVDPYAYANLLPALHQHADGEWEAHLCEGYAVITTLPWGISPRIGRFRQTFGRINLMHEHVLPWLDYPQVLRRYFGEEGFVGNGLGIDWLIPNPWDWYIQLTYEFTMDPSQEFLGKKTTGVRHNICLQHFIEITEASRLLPILSYAYDPERSGHVVGIGLNYKWEPPAKKLYKNLSVDSEIYISDSEYESGWNKAWGAYLGCRYQFSRRWAFGARYDFVQMPWNDKYQEHVYSVYLTFIQSEFMLWRIGYSFLERNFYIGRDQDEHRWSLQTQFTVGAHPVHKY